MNTSSSFVRCGVVAVYRFHRSWRTSWAFVAEEEGEEVLEGGMDDEEAGVWVVIGEEGMGGTPVVVLEEIWERLGAIAID